MISRKGAKRIKKRFLAKTQRRKENKEKISYNDVHY